MAALGTVTVAVRVRPEAEVKAEALREAAAAWDDPEKVEDLRTLAAEQYRAGGPSMPAIWLRERADRLASA